MWLSDGVHAREGKRLVGSGAASLVDGGNAFGDSDTEQLGDVVVLALKSEPLWLICSGFAAGFAGNVVSLYG